MTYSRISQKHKEEACKAFENDLKNVAIEYYQDRSFKFHKKTSECLSLWYIINDKDTGGIALADYTPDEAEKITNKTYSTFKSYVICVDISSGDYVATLKTSGSGSVVSLCN